MNIEVFMRIVREALCFCILYTPQHMVECASGSRLLFSLTIYVTDADVKMLHVAHNKLKNNMAAQKWHHNQLKTS